MKREDVYKLIDGERDYQDGLDDDRTDGGSHSVGDYLVMLDTYLRRAKDDWTNRPGVKDALDEIRKIAGIAVHCMEEHNTPSRGEIKTREIISDITFENGTMTVTKERLC